MSDSESPDHSVTPDEWANMDESEREAYFEKKSEELASAADEGAKLSEDEQAALRTLEEAHEGETAMVHLRRGLEVEVKTYLSGRMEDRLQHIDENRRDFETVRSELVKSLAWLTVSDTYSEELWRTYADEYGVLALSELFFDCIEPALDRLEDTEVAKRFRRDG
jgi:hypothetical protein